MQWLIYQFQKSFFLTDYPINTYTTSINSPFCILRGCSHNYYKNFVFLSLKIKFILANSEGPDEMPQIAAFHLGLHCLRKYPLGISSLQRVNAFQ